MSQNADLATLGRAPLFELLQPDALRLVVAAAESRSLKNGDILFRRGDHSDGGYVVMKGAIALHAGDAKSTPFVAGESCLIGRTALFARVPRPATAMARDLSTVLRISRALMRRVLEEFPDAAPDLQEVLAQDLSDLTDGLERVRRKLLAIDRVPGALA